MSDRWAYALLVLIMTVVAATVGGVAVGTLGQLQIGERKAALLEATSLQAQQLQQYGADLLLGESLDSAATRRIERVLGGDARILIGRISGSQLEFLSIPGLQTAPMQPPPAADAALTMAMQRAWPVRPAPNGSPAKVVYPSFSPFVRSRSATSASSPKCA
ncbi:hypothetical protein [Defluviicoccus vanus]|uniref:Uncharacterized protein n=1 Tax=Defluviicoccus vanus TaxID=111831 RepID=A0A7H1MZP1_9PROT|nr:hypothetical protein [Defluviicoccus vanus]QNT68927.1 hypothetical protein HQ394_05605 [Defluviicoccus vanus]